MTATTEPTGAKRRRVFSGVQPTGKLHIGNYLGALAVWAQEQHRFDSLFCVVDLHALTVPEAVDPGGLRTKVREVAALYVAAGVDPERSTIFVQSEVPAHSELAWLLTCTTPLGWLQRMTQFKAKAGRLGSVGTGLLCYPVLQAADILLYETDLVPVGEDQRQHVELARDVALRFNSLFGEVFVPPEAMIRSGGARIMGLDDPTAKMSKSTGERVPGHSVGLLDPPPVVRKAIMGARTDSGREFRYDVATPGVRNLMDLYEALGGEESRDALAERLERDGKGYGHLKAEVAERVEATLAPIRDAYARISADPAYLDGILARGAERARDLATPVLRRAQRAAGVGR